MSFVKSIFTLGLINFVLTIGVLSAAQVISGQSETLASPSPTTISPVLTTIPTPTPTVQVIIKKIIRPKVAMKNTVAASPSPTQAPVPTQDPLAGKCLIYIDGIRYDMTDFRKIHGGGDIFQCGTDMSQIFHAQHPDSYLALIAKYKI